MRHCTCFSWCIKPFPILSSVPQFKETRTSIIRPFTFSQPYLLSLLYSTMNFSPTVHPNSPCISKLYANCFPCLGGSSQLYFAKVLLNLQHKRNLLCEFIVHLHQPSKFLSHQYSHSTLHSAFLSQGSSWSLMMNCYVCLSQKNVSLSVVGHTLPQPSVQNLVFKKVLVIKMNGHSPSQFSYQSHPFPFT